ncbi:PLP-dependent aminotransferase family protein [Leptospira sp. WS60.C2]
MGTNLTNLFLAKRTKSIRTSIIREILKITVKDSEFLSFAGGLPNPNLLPSELIQLATEKTMSFNRSEALQYGDSNGYRNLRSQILERFLDLKDLDLDSICITHGSQQSLDILGKLLMDEETNVLLEDPTYLGALQAFSPYEPKMFSLSLEADGPDLLELETILSKDKIHCFYCNPSYQNPSTNTWSIAKRKQVASLLDEYGVILIEDEAYKYLDFSGEVFPSIASFRKNLDLTFVLGSFSKIISPGFRLGWTVVPKSYQKYFTAIKQGNDLNSNQYSQIVMDHLLSNLNIDTHLAKIQMYYRKQKEHMRFCLAKYLPEVTYHDPLGGMFLWVNFPFVSEGEFMEKMMEKKVVMVPGNEFRLFGIESVFFRMNFSFLGEVEMEEGIRRMASVYHDIIT